MKKIFQLIFAITLTLKLSAQAPQKFSYQAVIRNTNNNLITNTQVKMRISILQGSSSGTVVYSEIHSPTTNINGLATVEIGNGTNQTGSFANINWASGTFFLKTETDPTNGTNYSVVGSTQLLSTPYALYAAQSANGVPGTSNLGDMLYWDGSKWQKIPIGKSGQYLKINNNNMPAWSGDSYPVIQTLPPTNITSNGFTGNMKLVSMGLAPSQERFLFNDYFKGICWSINPNPVADGNEYTSDSISTPANYSYVVGGSTNSFQDILSNTKYYIRAFAVNGSGVVYGNELNFTTLNGPVSLPAISNFFAGTYASNPTSQISFSFTITQGGAFVTQRGVIWSTSKNLTTSLNTKTSNGIGGGYVSGKITGLNPYTTYYVRPYAINSAGTSYGDVVEVKTTGPPPVVTTSAVSSISSNSAICGGNITSNNGDTYLSGGVVWAEFPSPNIILTSKTTDIYNTGVFTSIITELKPYTTYYLRAYAIYSGGVSYGNEITFKTTNGPAVALPSSNSLFIVGAATQAGWANPVPVPTQEFARIDETTFGGIFELNGGELYSLLPVNGSWDSRYVISNNTLPGIDTAGTFFLSNGPGSDFKAPAYSGLYKFTVDFQAGRYKVEPFTQIHGLPWDLFIVGSATPGGWNNPVPDPQQKLTRKNSVEWDITLNFTSGEAYLLLPTNGSWGRRFGTDNQFSPDARLGGKIKPEGADIPAPTVSGNYKLSVDFFKGTYQLIAQ